jgi:hypothetical protein
VSSVLSASVGKEVWGNALAGGGLGALVDFQNSSAFQYPEKIQLEPELCKSDNIKNFLKPLSQ